MDGAAYGMRCPASNTLALPGGRGWGEAVSVQVRLRGLADGQIAQGVYWIVWRLEIAWPQVVQRWWRRWCSSRRWACLADGGLEQEDSLSALGRRKDMQAVPCRASGLSGRAGWPRGLQESKLE